MQKSGDVVLPGVIQKESEIIPGITKQLWVFLAYVATAKLAILLALPPGYASPVWPAAGIAMAAMIVWGPSLAIAIFLGSIATNLRLDELLQNPTDQILLQLCLALGTSIQAYLGSLLFHMVEQRWPAAVNPRRLALELILLGPFACLTAATVGAAALTVFHVIEAHMFLDHWTSWWLGDSFGAGVLCPLLVRAYRSLPTRPIRQQSLPYLAIPMVLSVLIVAALVVHLRNNDRRNQQVLEHSVSDFHQTVFDRVERVHEDLNQIVEYTGAIEPGKLIEHFKNQPLTGMQLFWVPRVPAEERAAFESNLGHDHQHFTILEKTATGHFAPSAARPIHWPVLTGPEADGNLLPPGFDLASFAGMPEILQKAWETGAVFSSPLLTVGQNKKAIFLLRKSQGGLFASLVRLDQLITSALPDLRHPVVRVQIEALNDKTSSAPFTSWFGLSPLETQHARAFGHYPKVLKIGQQELSFQVSFPAAAFHGGRMGDPMFVTALCMVLAFAVNIIFLSQKTQPTVIDPAARNQQDELRQQFEALREADRNKAQLLANISHQIHSPLQGIIGLLDMLRGSSLDSKQRSSIDTIIANCHSMRLMLEDVQTFARLESDQLSLAHEEFLMEECLKDLTSIYEIAAEERQNEFGADIQLPPMLRVHGDRRRLHRVLSHILSDAIGRTHKGRLTLAVFLDAERHLQITVESQSHSQAEAHDNEWEFGNAKAFSSLEIFNLKICERIVEAMGGRFSLDRPAALVSRVSLSLPLPITTSMETEARIESPEPRYQNVLVVDDNAINLTVASGLLAKLGYSVDTAANGYEAVVKAEARHYDVIFMDCQMPDMDGYDATRHIRNLTGSRERPLIIALTANALGDGRSRAREAGMDDLLMKPISRDILIRTIGHAKQAPKEAVEPIAPLVDYKAFSMGLGDDSDLIQTAVLRYFEEIDGMMQRLRSEVERQDVNSVARTAHTLKGMTSLFAAHALVEANKNLEIAAKEKRTDEFMALFKRVENLTELLKMELKKLVEDKSSTKKDVA